MSLPFAPLATLFFLIPVFLVETSMFGLEGGKPLKNPKIKVHLGGGSFTGEGYCTMDWAIHLSKPRDKSQTRTKETFWQWKCPMD